MITVLFLAAHILRLAEPAVVTVRLRGDLSGSEAREIVHVAREHLEGRPGRVLIDLAGLDHVPEDCADLVDALLAEAAADVQVRYVAIVRSLAHQRTFLPTPENPTEPLVLRRHRDDRPSLYLRYFDHPADALTWLCLPVDLLWATREAIYLTHFF
ncbi:hypothetical protein [Haliangium sp. UPWRP_2]|uniref:hypothetical protein n=1 Tax=Haliangium sp. UPWRP_2 TaxID=1931276 RepID=UPI000B538FE0|nr:hypothetical protein [Haliangium sp. UPWRP_2]PSM31611.1 hypothetical protein BVG81_004485 [Haliangium sp. UPWRP_2]HNN96017.1 hypothetical protein [Pseudomonadota bacterium]